MEHSNNTVCVISLFIYTAAELQLDVLLTFFSYCGAKTSIHSWLFVSTVSMKLSSLQGCLLQHGSSKSKLMLLIIYVPHPHEETYCAPEHHHGMQCCPSAPCHTLPPDNTHFASLQSAKCKVVSPMSNLNKP